MRTAAVPWWVATADLLLGADCAGCGTPWWGACRECRTHVTGEPTRLTRPTPAPVGFPLTATAGPYDEVFSGLIHAHKEEQALMLTPLLGDRLAAAALELLHAVAVDPGSIILVPVPSSAAAVRDRGFDSTAALARRAARRLRVAGRPARVSSLLAQRRGLADQALLDAGSRAANLRGGLRLRRPAGLLGVDAAAPVVVVDDVVTTGASLTEAVQTLCDGGFDVLGAATVSATVRRRSAGSSD
ncbi:MAG: ComF family protein [Microlunatus sp.]|nr:ComF family protein [Microlunatus sp.]